MRKLQRVLFLILVSLITFCPMVKITVSAGDAITIQIGEKAGKKGDRITIPISLEGEGVAGMDFTVAYDPQELAYVGAVKGESAKRGELCDINHIKERSTIHYVYVSNKAIEKNGDILLLSFDVLEDSEAKHTVDVKVKKILNPNIEELPYQIEGGRMIASQEGNSQGGQNGDTNVGSTQNRGDATSQDNPESEEGSELQDGTVDGELKKSNTAERKQQNKKRIVVKTKDGLKEVTDSVGKKTNENLLNEEESKIENDENSKTLGIVCAIVVVVLLAGGYAVWRKKKR